MLDGASAEIRQPGEPSRQVPVPAAQQCHRRRHEDGANDCGVDDDGHRQPEADLLQLAQAAGGKGAEHRHHDERGAGDYPPRMTHAEGHGLASVACLIESLSDATHQEDVIVHRKAEEDGKEKERNPEGDHVQLFEAEDLVQKAVLEDEHKQPVGGPDGKQVPLQH